jgi:hypothetical protein
MSNHLPPVPPANQSHKGPGNDLKPEQDNSKKHPGLQNAAVSPFHWVPNSIGLRSLKHLQSRALRSKVGLPI